MAQALTEFQLDTSGVVVSSAHPFHPYSWDGVEPGTFPLSPFVQGYVEALFASLRTTNPEAVKALAQMPAPLREQRMVLRERCHWSRAQPWPSLCDQMVLLGLIVVVARGAGDTVTEPTDLGRAVLTFLYAFSDLAPETLARIIEDCAAVQQIIDGYAGRPDLQRIQGRDFWTARQNGKWSVLNRVVRFPPQTLSLGDDGKVRFQ